MDIVTVIGTVVASQKVSTLEGYKLLLVLDESGSDSAQPVVALDTVGAGAGETVLLVRGSSARAVAGLTDSPVDAVIVGIIDTVERDGRIVFQKHKTPAEEVAR
ncbi:MAG TPA: EutN/CcmL family microcompartment protein [candidate division Zixibacteria bacterium]|jgi:microcompartment protein CcmK/EutM